MMFEILTRLMPAPLAFVTCIFLITSLPAAILINSNKRLGRRSWVWAAISFAMAAWAVLRRYRLEDAEVFLPFLFLYPISWLAYFTLYRLATASWVLKMLHLTSKEHAKPETKESAARPGKKSPSIQRGDI